jgi:tetratricopeptide (TPR) repeat protein/serine/threonine protein kinase
MSERDLFVAALQISDPVQRSAWLDRECGGDAALRQRIEVLLQALDKAGSLLDNPVVVPKADVSETGPGVQASIAGSEPAAEQPGAVIGPYKLLEQIGEGGMGAVWMAQQTEPVRRLVAVKLVKAGMDSRHVIVRFEAERQALALMDHPNIARVLDGGTTDAGRPYFVMDLVKGVPITRYSDEHHLTPRQRLGLFLPVCQAVQHAHQKGIIHRDLKPSNVLVALYDGKPVPKVIDFGVAKAVGQSLTDKTLVTGFGNIVGTLEYMSPEQAEVNQLDIDTRSDIYALGVLLYELLAGSPPFTRKGLERAGMLEMLRVIREQEPTKPSAMLSTAEGLPTLAANRGTEPAKLTRLVRGELDWIVMKALEKDRSRRYETANGFAADVQRYLADEPVLAGPPSGWYRFRKFARRNKGALAVAGLVLFFLVLLGSGVGWAVRDRAARHAKVAGEVESILGEVDRLEGEQKWPEALAAVRRAAAVVASGQADAATAQRVRELLKDLEFIDRLERTRMGRATVVDGEFNYAGLDRDYAQAFRDYGVDVDALAVETSIDRLKTRPALAIPLAAALDEWARCRRVLSEADAAAWKRLVTVARGIDPEPLRDWIRATWEQPVSAGEQELRRVAGSIDVRAQHPATLETLASTLARGKDLDSVVRLLQDAQFAYPGDFWLNFGLALVLSKQQDYEGAIRYYTAAVSIRPHAPAALNNLGNALRSQKKWNEAIAAYHKAIEMDPNYFAPHLNLGNALRDQKKLDEAIDSYRKAIELKPNHANSYFALGCVLRAQQKVDEAITAHRKAIELDPKHANAYVDLGAILCDVRREYENAVACFRKAIELDPKHANAYGDLGVALIHQGKLDEAIAAYRKAIELDPKHPNASLGLAECAWALATHAEPARRDPGRALKLAREAVEIAPNSDMSCMSWQYLGWIHYHMGNWKSCIEVLEKLCKRQDGGTGDCCQWIVLALAHARLAAQEGLPEKAREHHQAEARRRFEEADKQIDSWWRVRPGDYLGQAVWDFRAEARELMAPKDGKN